MTKFADLLTLSSTRTADPASTGIDRFVRLSTHRAREPAIRSWGNDADRTTFTSTFNRGQVLFAKRRANDGNLSIPLYVRGKTVNEEKGEYAADGLKAAVKAWEESSVKLNFSIEKLLNNLE